MWKEQPLFGFGLKSFRIKCHDTYKKNAHLLPSSKIPKFSCSNHPHNYYLELLSESGLFGFSLMLFFFVILMKNCLYHFKNYIKEMNPETVLFIPIILGVIIEVWPLRSSGSFFTTWNATFFWLNVGMLLAYNKK